MEAKGIIFRNERGQWMMKVKTHLIGKYRIVCDKYGDIITLRFKNSAIEYLVNHCGVLTKNITVQEG